MTNSRYSASKTPTRRVYASGRLETWGTSVSEATIEKAVQRLARQRGNSSR
jgi:hypothetical protein